MIMLSRSPESRDIVAAYAGVMLRIAEIKTMVKSTSCLGKKNRWYFKSCIQSYMYAHRALNWQWYLLLKVGMPAQNSNHAKPDVP
jgi:hypothetical protein